MKILITGASGSGTTTLGKTLASRLNYAFFDADDYYWLPTEPLYTKKRDHDSRLQMLLGELNKNSACIVSGSIMNWGAELENAFDVIVFLYLETSIRVKRLRAREESEFGHACPEFLKWAAEYDTGPASGRSLAKHMLWLTARRCKVIELSGDLSVEKRCALLMESLPDIVGIGFPSEQMPSYSV